MLLKLIIIVSELLLGLPGHQRDHQHLSCGEFVSGEGGEHRWILSQEIEIR